LIAFFFKGNKTSTKSPTNSVNTEPRLLKN